ncbi:MAG: membrane associated rhomboid family serine protease [Patiriisocius sp.]|jgi:membrane associated rhomboid family serine protease
MTSSKKLYFSEDVLLYPLLFVFILWVVFWIEIRFNLDFNVYGIRPERIVGLRGIFFSPFIHGNLQHLFNNSIPLFVLSAGLFYFYRSIRWKILILGIIAVGLITWLIGRPSNHIGASGIIYLLASFLFFKGLFSKQYQLVALSFAVVFIYGSLLWYVFPINPSISWEGHLAGFMVGLVFALIFKNKDVVSKKYEWEQEDYDPAKDPFMMQFDENGNFIESPKEEINKVTPGKEQLSTTLLEEGTIHYRYKPKGDIDLD